MQMHITVEGLDVQSVEVRLLQDSVIFVTLLEYRVIVILFIIFQWLLKWFQCIALIFQRDFGFKELYCIF